MAQAIPICAGTLHLCRVRVTLLDSLGNVAAGPNNSYVTNTPLSIAWTPEIDTGPDIVKRGGCDCIDLSYKGNDLLKRFTLAFLDDLIEPALFSMMTGGPVILDQSDSPVPIGMWFANQSSCSTSPPPNIAFEAWSDVWSGNAQNGVLENWHWLWPNSRWQFGASTLENNFGQPTLNGFTIFNDLWGHGPYADSAEVCPGMPGFWQTADGMPDPECGYQTVSPSS